jgi:uncharacterized Zn-binding protein involved in type VI secretion
VTKPVAKGGDRVVGVDTHVIMIPSPGGPVPTPLPSPFSGILQNDLSSTVMVDGQGVAVVGSGADNLPPHIPAGGPFQTPPSNKSTISQGSDTIFVDNKALARMGDPVKCCNDPADQDTGTVIAVGTVFAS